MRNYFTLIVLSTVVLVAVFILGFISLSFVQAQEGTFALDESYLEDVKKSAPAVEIKPGETKPSVSNSSRRFGEESVSERIAKEKVQLEQKAEDLKADSPKLTNEQEIMEHTSSIIEKARQATSIPTRK